MEETLPDTWQDASDIAQLLEIATRKEYREYVKNTDTCLPLSPSSKYDDFPNWRTFLGKRDPSNYYDSPQEAAEAAKNLLEVHTKRRYKERWREDPRLPEDPTDFYPDCTSWNEFFDKRNPDEYVDHWREASDVVQNELSKPPRKARGYQYFRYKEHPCLPSNPARDFDNFPGWDIFLGKEDH